MPIPRLPAVLLIAAIALGCQAGTARLGRPLPEGQSYDVPPEPMRTVQPVYPESARRAGIAGTVVLHVLVEKNGQVDAVKVVQSLPGLDGLAVAAAKQWAFRPAMKNHAPVPAWYEVLMKFPP
jgi:TonB family protein